MSVEDVEQLAAGSMRIWSIVPDQSLEPLRSKVRVCQALPEMVALTDLVSENDVSVLRLQYSFAVLSEQLLLI